MPIEVPWLRNDSGEDSAEMPDVFYGGTVLTGDMGMSDDLDDDEELDETPADVIDMLGFDPKDMSTKDAEWKEAEHERAPDGRFGLEPGQSTESKHRDGKGHWSAERKTLHDKIVSKLVGDRKGSDKPTSYILGGGSASGKSTTFKAMTGASHEDLLSIDSDLLKEELPEYEWLKKTDPEHAAARVHEESSSLAKQIMAQAAAKKIDFAYDSTGSGAALPDVAKRLHKAGYQVHAMYFDVPIETARKRAASRAASTGRHIPDEVLNATHAGSAAGFMKLKDSEHLASVTLHDTSERVPALVYRRGDGETGVVVDKSKWAKYQKKAGM